MADSGITFDANYQIRVLDADKFTATETLQAQAGEFVGKVTEFDNSEGAAPRARTQWPRRAGLSAGAPARLRAIRRYQGRALLATSL